MISFSRTGLIAATLVFLFFEGAAAIAAPCLDWQQSRALAAKAVQTRLMVAALSCGLRDPYNEFVVKFDLELVEHSSTLMSWHRQNYGADGDRAFHNLMTRIANEASADNVSASREFCRLAAETFKFYLTTASDSIAAMLPASATARRFGVATCRSIGNDYQIKSATQNVPVTAWPKADVAAD